MADQQTAFHDLQEEDPGRDIKRRRKGQARIAQASGSLDRTVAEMEEMHRTDQPQGEKEGMVLNHPPPEFETPIEFVPIDPERLREVHHEHD